MPNLFGRRHSMAGSLAASSLMLGGSPVFANETMSGNGGERTYAPSDIIVQGEWDGYASNDGSTAMKTPTALIDTPQSVAVITRDQLNDQNVRQLGEALRYVAGISIETGEGHRDEIFIRGQETTADFYLNGLRDDAQYYRSLFDVERVEILKGANALTFGRGGGGGIVNRVSKTADLQQSFVAGSAGIDTFGAVALSADINQPLSEMAGFRFNAAYETFDSHRDFYEGRFFGVAPTITAMLSERTRLVLAYSYTDDERVTDRGIPALNGGPLDNADKIFFGDPDFNEARAKVHIARARLDHDFSDTLSVNASLQYADYDKIYANIIPASSTGNTVDLTGYRDGTQRENWIAQGNLVWKGDTGGIGHTLLAGVEFIGQDTANFRDVVHFGSVTGPTRVTVPLDRTIAVPDFFLEPLARNRASELTVFSAYLQDQIEIGDMIQFVAGIRFERFDLETVDLTSNTPANRTDEKWSPRFGLIVKPQDNLSFYASYSESFLPQAGDQFLLLSPTSATLAPEKFENIEAGVKWAVRPSLLFNAAIFQLERTNSPTTDPTDPTLTVLTGKTRTQGFELSLAGEIQDNWHISLGYSYLDGEIRSQVGGSPAGTTLEQVPDHHITAWTRYNFSPMFGLGAGVVHSSSQFASLSNNVVLPSYTRVDLAAYFDISPNVAVQFNVENLFDEDYYPSAHGDNNIQPARPLNASMTARLRF